MPRGNPADTGIQHPISESAIPHLATDPFREPTGRSSDARNCQDTLQLLLAPGWASARGTLAVGRVGCHATSLLRSVRLPDLVTPADYAGVAPNASMMIDALTGLWPPALGVMFRAAGQPWAAEGDQPGMSVFLRDGNDVYHSYSSYARGSDILVATFNYLDLTPLGRQFHVGEARRHDAYDA
jgi:hypothetical protein